MLDIALAELVETGSVRPNQDGGRKEIPVSPALIEGASNDPLTLSILIIKEAGLGA